MNPQHDEHAGRAPMAFPPGHFYSPIADIDAVQRDADRIWSDDTAASSVMPVEPQLELLRRLQGHYCDLLPWTAQQQRGLRFYHGQFFFWGTDALVWFGVLLEFRPRRVIEVGSGHSSHLLIDVNEHLCNGDMVLTFIEPYPERLQSALADSDADRIEILPMRVQDVPLARFESLQAGDVLFIDSSHVSKCGSDVNHLFFEVLPRLSDGVLIHVHDIFWPFEYPRHWIEKGRGWNEVHVLRGLLADSRRYQPLLFVDQLLQLHSECFEPERALHSEVGAHGSFWMQVRS